MSWSWTCRTSFSGCKIIKQENILKTLLLIQIFENADASPNSEIEREAVYVSRLQGKKWGIQVKTNMEDEAKYTCLHLNSWEADLDAFYVVDDNVKHGGNQSIQDLDALSCFESTDSAQTSLPKSEAALNDDLQLTSKQKDEREFWFYDDQCVDLGITNFLASEQCARVSTDLNSHWMEPETIRPWWQTAGKDELAYLVAQRSLDNIENCDLPQPQIKVLDHEKTLPSSLNQKAEFEIGYASGVTTSGCSLQDSDIPFSCSKSKDSDTSNKSDQTESENNSKAELLKALCHSQTRAREAEKAAQQAYNDKEHIVSLFFRQASQLFAYKQWLQILQLENLCLQLRIKNNPLLISCKGKQLKKRKRKRSNRRCVIGKCAVAFAVGLGLAGAGLFLGWTMTWMFPSI